MEKLHTKSIVELKELLDRQRKVLSNAKLVGKLPDKGAKVQEFSKKVTEELIKRTEVVDKTSNLLQKMVLTDGREDNKEYDEDLLKQFMNPACNAKQVSNEEACEADGTFINAYDKAMKDQSKASKFKPFSTIKHQHVNELSKDAMDRLGVSNVNCNECSDNLKEKNAPSTPRVKYGYDDSLCINKSNKHQNKPAKVITVEESISLQLEQEKDYKKLQASHILANRLHIKTAPFCPEGSLQPRITSNNDADLSDDDHSDIDYPD